MTEFETITCTNCADQFKVYPGANAADTEYCSPQCHEAAAIE